MLYLLAFKHEGQEFLLYQNGSFVGSARESEARQALLKHTGKSIGVGGFTVRAFQDMEALKAVVGLPFKIIAFEGGLGIPFEGVPLLPPKT